MTINNPIKHSKWALVGILTLGAVLRLYNLDGKPLWCDEYRYLTFSEYGLIASMKLLISQEYSVLFPLSYMISIIWSKVAGNSDFMLRIPSVGYGVATLYVAYRLGKDLYEEKVGLMAAFLLALSPFHLMWSRIAVMYSLLAFLSSLSLFFFLRILKKDTLINWMAFVIVNILNMHIHPYGFFFILCENIFFLLSIKRYGKLWPRWVVSQLVIAICFLPWLFLNFKAMVGYAGAGYFMSSFNYPLKLAFTLFSFSLGESVKPWNIVVTIPAAIIFAISILKGIREMFKEKSRETYLILLFFCLPLFLGLISPTTTPKHLIFLVPLFLLIVTKGVFSFTRKIFQYLTIVSIILFFVISLSNYYRNREIQRADMVIPWKEIIKTIKSEAPPETAILVPNIFAIPFERYHDGTFYSYGKSWYNTLPPGVHQHTSHTRQVRLDFYKYRRSKMQEEKASSIQEFVKLQNKVWVIIDYQTEEDVRKFIEEYPKILIQKKYVEEERAIKGFLAGDVNKYKYYLMELYLIEGGKSDYQK